MRSSIRRAISHTPLQRQPFAECLMTAFALIVVSITTADCAIQADESPATKEEIHSFYVRAVTGPLAGKSVCYVCRYGDRPVVLVLLRQLSADATALLKDLDNLVNDHRAEGLRCYAVLLTDTPQRDLARLQTLAFDEKIDLPLTLATDASTIGSALDFPRDTTLAVVTYASRRVIDRFQFQPGSCTAKSRSEVLVAAKTLIVDPPALHP